jgi:5-(carboxyamino)imidazole ribonucleotide synthase
MTTKLGILGGGQLGRMLIQAATDWNLDIHVLDDNSSAPCCNTATVFQIGSITDYQTVYDFGKTVDILTIEIENVNVDALEQLEKEGLKVFPQPRVIRTIQDKRLQKQFYSLHHIPTSEYILVENQADVQANTDFLPAFNKLGTEGYDGKGVVKITNPEDIAKAFDKPGLLERLVDIEKELSVIVARNEKGQLTAFPPVELVYNTKYNLVDYLLSPAQISDAIAEKATEVAQQVITAFDMVGILAVELFYTKSGEILVNEVAPRPHNSGHHSIEANITSQFQQHLRSVLNLPLGDTAIRTPAAMINILGAEGYEGQAYYKNLDQLLSETGVFVHLYGKKITKPSRKMGHLTIIDKDVNTLVQRVETLKEVLQCIAK